MPDSSRRRVSGSARVTPIGERVTAPTPPNGVTKRNFSQSATSMSWGTSADTPAYRNAPRRRSVRPLGFRSSSPSLTKCTLPIARILPGSTT